MITADLSSLKHAQQVLALRIAWYGQQINRQSNHTLDDDLLGESRFILEQLDELEDDIAMLRAVSNVAIRVVIAGGVPDDDVVPLPKCRRY